MTISSQICYLFRVQDGKVARITIYIDYRIMMSQLDMLIS